MQSPLLYSPSPIAQPCPSYPFPDVTCLHRYGSVLPESFDRIVVPVPGYTDTYASTSVPGDVSFEAVGAADFLLYDAIRGAEILGDEPTLQFMFALDDVPHEGPTWEPELNLFYFSRLRAEPKAQYVVDLNVEPPTLETRVSDPPLVVPCGSTYHEGLIYWCGSATQSGNYVPGMYALNASTGKVQTVVNNYFGYRFGTCNDLAVAKNGDIWFTDDWYMRVIPDLRLNDTAQMTTGVWRHQPSTGLTQLVADSFDQPNGIAFSPDGKTVYITDTGADAVTPEGDKAIKYHSYRARTVYAADVLPSGAGIKNLRPIFLGQDRVPDGIRVANNGYLVTASGHGVDVLDESGIHIMRVQTNFTVLNLAWAGREGTHLWMVGHGGVARVKWALEGRKLKWD